jgi:hypothetical protein
MKILRGKNARNVHLGNISGQVWLYNNSMYLLPHTRRIAFLGFQTIIKKYNILGRLVKSIQSWKSNTVETVSIITE